MERVNPYYIPYKGMIWRQFHDDFIYNSMKSFRAKPFKYIYISLKSAKWLHPAHYTSPTMPPPLDWPHYATHTCYTTQTFCSNHKNWLSMPFLQAASETTVMSSSSSFFDGSPLFSPSVPQPEILLAWL